VHTFSRSYFKREIFSTDRETFGLQFLEYTQLQKIIFIQCEFLFKLPTLENIFKSYYKPKVTESQRFFFFFP